MTIPVALYIKKADDGFDLVVKTLNDGVEHFVNDNTITTTTEAFELFEFLKDKSNENENYDIQYVSDNIL